MSFLNVYSSMVFDCDGVILNSNGVKTQAFYNSTLSYGKAYAQALVEYHVKNGGVSRYRKYEYFLSSILGKEIVQDELNSLLDFFADEVKQGLMSCDVADGLEKLREENHHSIWFIVSGGDQAELREIFTARGLNVFFDGGIFGSPDSKDVILQREIVGRGFAGPGLFVGDSQYDYEAATHAGLDFVFVSKWSEFSGASSYFEGKNISVVDSISDLCL